MKIFLVKNVGSSPGKIMSMFAHEKDAKAFAETLKARLKDQFDVEERTLFYGQPPLCGFNQ